MRPRRKNSIGSRLKSLELDVKYLRAELQILKNGNKHTWQEGETRINKFGRVEIRNGKGSVKSSVVKRKALL